MRRLHLITMLGLLMAGCPDRPTGDDGADPATGTSGSAATDDDASATDPIPSCPEGQEWCDGACNNFASDAFNCGECGRKCPLAEVNPTSCKDHGDCVPGYGPCVHPADSIPHCEALCNTVGQHCAEGRHRMWFSSQDGASCNHKTSSTMTVDAVCDAPFAWDKIGGFGDPAVAAMCLCTNDF